MDRSSLNIFLTALVQAWRFKSPSKKATKLIIPPTTAAYTLIIPQPCITSVDVLRGRAGRQGTEWRVGPQSAPRPHQLRSSVGAKTPQTLSQRSSVTPCPSGLCAGGRRRAGGGPRDGDPAEVALTSQTSEFVAAIQQTSSRTPRPRAPTPPRRSRLRRAKEAAKAPEPNKSC